MDAPKIDQGKQGAVLAIWVRPKASKPGVGGLRGDALQVAVSAAPVDGAANRSVVKVLSRALDVPASSLEIVRGHRSRQKSVEFRTLNPQDLAERISRLQTDG